MLNPRERVEKCLRGGHADKVPFTLYDTKVVTCAAEREMRNRGMCVVKRGILPYRSRRPNVKVTSHTFNEDGKTLTRTVYETPEGELTALSETTATSTWRHEKLFKTPDDYKALRFYLEDEQGFEPNYAALEKADKELGGDVILRGGIGLEPMQALQSGGLMDMQTFCIEWAMNRDEILKLYEIIVEKHRQIYPIIAEAPITHVNYGGNVTPEIVGPDMFRQYYMPHYHEAAEALHKGGVLIGSHFDANCGALRELIAETPLDYIEAFSPAPDTDMTLREARDAWPDKVIWINFPSSQHRHPDEKVAQIAFDLCDSLDSSDGLLFGITESYPEDRWQGSFLAIMDGLERHARERPERYTP